jgi:NADPH:quinone reductase-like Zn-dependent oxidoreductase
MKAGLLMNHGGPEMLRYGEAPDPIAGPGEILVDIHAASLNAADWCVWAEAAIASSSRISWAVIF